jgi:alpha-amylase/alpha-mannosidase (GH57 family)
MPLANARDRETQVLWGIRDFEYRFNRKPEGMWLAETAVDTASLELLAENDIKFTILAPRQARGFRKIGEEAWTSTETKPIDTRRPYLFQLPSGKSIVLFFYDGTISQGVAFDGLLNDGKKFAERLLDTLDNTAEPQLAHIATDGETYGHHHKHGDMALAFCLDYIDRNKYSNLTNYSQFLAKHAPAYAIPAENRTGIRNGANPCVKHWTGSAMNW